MSHFDINKLFLVSSIGISIIPMLWIFMPNFYALFALEILTGVTWGAFELSFHIICFETIPTNQQAKVMSRYNLLHTICIGIGSIAGIYTFYLLGPTLETYYWIFGISSLLRFASIIIFPRRIVFNRQVVVTHLQRILGVRPNMGAINRPMWQIFKKVRKRK